MKDFVVLKYLDKNSFYRKFSYVSDRTIIDIDILAQNFLQDCFILRNNKLSKLNYFFFSKKQINAHFLRYICYFKILINF